VLAVESIACGPCTDLYCVDIVRVVKVTKNRNGATIPSGISIGREPWAPPLPSGRFSISLAVYCSVGSTIWQVFVKGHETETAWTRRITGFEPVN
jgi:hypothetical protein